MEYDVVIVGAGLAGCVMANTLSLNKKVLIVEVMSTFDPSESERLPGFVLL